MIRKRIVNLISGCRCVYSGKISQTCSVTKYLVSAGPVFKIHNIRNLSSVVKENKLLFEDKKHLPKETEVKSLLEPCSDIDVSHIGKALSPSYNLAAYVNKSPTLQEFVKLGVELYKLDMKAGVPEIILALDFERDVKPMILFLHDNGVPTDKLGRFFTKNSKIFTENLDDLQIRINYLESKKFTKEDIGKIITRNPLWLSFSVDKIDSRLGYFQTTYNLTGNDVRKLTLTSPRLITQSLGKVNLNTFVLREEIGFDDRQIKSLILRRPRLLEMGQKNLLSTFEYLHKTMDISLQDIYKEPKILCCRQSRLRERHMFLQSLGKAQYNSLLPGYIAVMDMVVGTDAEFSENIAKSSIHTFNLFLKTL